MKKFIILLFFTSLTVTSFSQKDSKAVQIIMKNMDIQEKAWNNFDIQGFMSYYWNNDSLKFIGNKGITYGWKSTLDNYIKECTEYINTCTSTDILLESNEVRSISR